MAKKKIVKKTAKKVTKKVASKPVKKATKKKNIKKAKPKTTIKISVSKKILEEAPEEFAFVLNDGRKLKSVQELTNSLETMSDDLFNYHVTDIKNDFANWIDDIFNESKLAEEMKKTKSRIETRIKLLQKLVDEVIAESKPKKK